MTHLGIALLVQETSWADGGLEEKYLLVVGGFPEKASGRSVGSSHQLEVEQ